MSHSPTPAESARYAKAIEASKRIRWDIDADVIRGRDFDFAHTFLPDGLSLADELEGLDDRQRRLLSQVQGRTYANMFALVERFIGAKMMEIGREHGLGDQTAMEALVRLTDEELKHQALFRRIEAMIAARMPPGYVFVPAANDVAGFVLGKSTWAVLALTCHIELFSQAHYRASIGVRDDLSPLFKDIFLFHWKEESQHAIIDEIEWQRLDRSLASDAERDAGVDDLLALVGGIDGILQAQAAADTGYFLRIAGLPESGPQAEAVGATMLKAYRWQYIVSGVLEPRFRKVLSEIVSAAQLQRIEAAMGPLVYAVPRKAAAQAMAA